MKIIQQQYSTHSFFNIAPGLGKTKLILAAAINLVQTTEFPVFVLNSDKTLCDRDFQEATFSLEELKIPFASVLSQQAKIIFSTTQDFIDFKDNLPEKYHTLLDEYQNIFFKEEKFFEFVEILNLSESFIGFSGSPLNSAQKKLLENSFNKKTLLLQLTPTTDLGDQETVVCKTQAQLIKELSQIADKFRLDTPQVFILDPQTAAALIKGRKKQPYVSLIDQEAPIVNNILSELFNKPSDDGSYGTYIINEEMGTGTNFKTSADIESKGGLVLVFGIKPTNTSTFEQLSCRVGRIFNKSRRFYVIHDSAYVGPNQQYLNYQLKILKQKENEDARALLSKLKLNNENQSDVSESNDDFKMQDETTNQISHTYNDSDESFCVERLEIQSKTPQNKETKNAKQVKKRLQKESDKIVSRESKLFQHNKEVEECKICGDAYIEPHFCQKDQISVQPEVSTSIIIQPEQVGSTELCLDEMALDLNFFLKCNSGFNPDQISAEQSGISNRKNSGIIFQHILISENVEKLSPQVDIQLQKRQRDTKNIDLLESLLTQEKQVQGSKQNEEKNKDHIMQKSKTNRYSSRKPLNAIDKAYFDNYSHKAIHDEMLNDKIRCETYKNAIAASVNGKTVLDVGAGTGFLSVIAAKAGAAHVYAVEVSEMANYAEQFINDNGCKENITLIKKRMEDVDMLDVPKIDVIISEWMGYLLLFENMLPSVLDARKRFLKEDGIMLPCEGRIYIAGVEWFGTEMNGVVLKPDKKTLNEAQIMLCGQDKVISNQCLVSEFNLQDCSNPLDDFGCQLFTLQLTKDAKVNAFVGWFDVALTGEISLSTAPSRPETHWKQTIFFLKKEIQAKAGEYIDGTFKISTNIHNHRSLKIDLAYKLSSQKSFLKQCFVLEQ